MPKIDALKEEISTLRELFRLWGLLLVTMLTGSGSVTLSVMTGLLAEKYAVLAVLLFLIAAVCGILVVKTLASLSGLTNELKEL